MLNILKKKMMGISYEETSFSSQGFETCDPVIKENLEKIIRMCADGYNLTLTFNDDLPALAEMLDQNFDNHHIGFALQGTGMYLAIKDLMTPWSTNYLREFTDAAGAKQDYITTLGAGFAVGRLPWGSIAMEHYMDTLDPEVAWSVPNGFGFHQGYFNHKLYIGQCKEAPKSLSRNYHDSFDIGIGRSIWLAGGASARKIKKYIDRFPEERRADLWCGTGIASSYAGGADISVLKEISKISGIHNIEFLSGIPFAAFTRKKGNNYADWTASVCNNLLEMSFEKTAVMLENLLDKVRAKMKHSEEKMRKQAYKELRKSLKATLQSEALLTE